MATTRTLADVFDPKLNALNALRLLLALSVVIWHSFPLTGTAITFAPLVQLLSHGGVDCFFAISGYLITSSWIRNPRIVPFLRARVLRIFPAFWVCLILTVVLFAPLAVLIRGVGFPDDFWHSGLTYLTHNFALRMFQYGIAGTPAGVPYPAVWDGALWTLFWEFLCYIGVFVLGVTRLIRWKATFIIVFVLLVVGVVLTSYGPLHNYWVDRGSQLGIMFVSGALVYRFERWVRVSKTWTVVALVILVASLWLPDYRVVAALPLAYLILSAGASIKHPRLTIRNDLSYGSYIYGFPLAQLLATLGAASLGVGVFAVLSVVVTLPVAAASWFAIERPALRLKARPPREMAPIREPVTKD